MKTMDDLIDKTTTDKHNGDVYSEDVREMTIEWIKNFMMAYSIGHDQLPDNFVLETTSGDYLKSIDKNEKYALFGFSLKCDSLENKQKPGIHVIAILMYMNNITKEDLK